MDIKDYVNNSRCPCCGHQGSISFLIGGFVTATEDGVDDTLDSSYVDKSQGITCPECHHEYTWQAGIDAERCWKAMPHILAACGHWLKARDKLLLNPHAMRELGLNKELIMATFERAADWAENS